MLDIKRWSTQWGGRELVIETGKYALQADAAVTVRYGDTIIMATVVKSKSIRPGIDYFPLMVSFEEKLYAAGKIKGSRFIKREGRPSDESILSGRVVDRCLRPLFDDTVRNDIQVVLTALSVDGENDAEITALIAASTALSFSSIPWEGPIAGARIGRAKDGDFVLNVTRSEVDDSSDLDLVVAGTSEKLVMVEAGASEVSEDVVFEAIKWGCQQLSPVVDLIKQAQTELGITKESESQPASDDSTAEDIDEEKIRDIVREHVSSAADSVIFNTPKISRKERRAMIDVLKEGASAALTAAGIDEDLHGSGLSQIKPYVCAEITKRILEKDQRLDGRGLTDVRELFSEVDSLPRVHGAAMFMRGDTQALSVVTLGAPGDVQTLDTMEEDGTKRYMHHYNDAPYTYGDAAPMRGPSRRAIGHGALAERALEPVLPSEEQFPYAIRVVSEILGSNGSSSMASTCGSSLSLMAAGVPITKPVAGIAMGLASDDHGNWKVLTDLQDVEDGKGGMDFKIAGTSEGITAVQMDTKTNGISMDIVKQTLHQAKEARVHILNHMMKTIPSVREELSPYAPRIETIMVDPEKIGEIIGPGGKVIKKITEETGATIDIEQDGRVLITTNDGDAMAKAREWIELIVKEVEVDETYDGTVVRLEDFGAFVQILPNKDGMVHVSEISWERTNKPGDVLNLGDVVKVKVKEIDNLGRVNLSMKALLPKPEGYVPPVERPRGPRKPFNKGGGGRGRFHKRS
jgi:polyribonucleotide nucleotidyltransferase